MGDATAQQKMDYWTGSSLFRSPWVAAPSSTTGRDGLGPLFNARSCNACHKDGGHGHLPDAGFGAVIRLSEYNTVLKHFAPSVSYGEQLQTLSIDSLIGGKTVPPEAALSLRWIETQKVFQREVVILRKPEPVFENLAYGNMSEHVRKSLRLAPPLFGLGLVQALSEKNILSREDVNDDNNDGISGKANRVFDREKQRVVVGRFGHKAEQANMRQQVAAAFNEDVGLSSWLYPAQTCTSAQASCNAMVTGNSIEEHVEISRVKLDLITHFSMLIKPPITKNKADKLKSHTGFSVFKRIGCSDCHVPFMKTAAHKLQSLNEKTFPLFGDMLLHDLGEGLSDGRPIYKASAQEWRTTPLWGLSRKLKEPVALLHDGRASSIKQAILWHGGEAQAAVKKYEKLNKIEQKSVTAFLEIL